MIENNCPSCPVCKNEVLLPFSIFENEMKTKTFGSWVCTNCGFCISTHNSKGSNPKEDITVYFIDELKIKIEELRRKHQNKRAQIY